MHYVTIPCVFTAKKRPRVERLIITPAEIIAEFMAPHQSVS